jgi:transcriptional regulator with XRE-family HTH domain
MEYEEKVVRAKNRIEFLRKVHGLRKQDIYKAMGFSRQHYHKKYQESPALSVKSLIGITTFLGISEQDLLHSTDEEFNKLPIVGAYLEYSKALTSYEKLKLGIWECEPFIKSS